MDRIGLDIWNDIQSTEPISNLINGSDLIGLLREVGKFWTWIWIRTQTLIDPTHLSDLDLSGDHGRTLQFTWICPGNFGDFRITSVISIISVIKLTLIGSLSVVEHNEVDRFLRRTQLQYL